MSMTAFYSHPDCRLHVMGRDHPECPERLTAVEDFLIAQGLDICFQFKDAPLLDPSQLTLAHSAGYVAEMGAMLAEVEASGLGKALDLDTIAAPGTWRAALRAAGAAIAATDDVIEGRCGNAYCHVRPPGHHATRQQAMGFCFFNNVALAARYALNEKKLARVAIVDFDVHHGNGTEDIVAGDERILMVSFFQHPLYPGTGAVPLGENMVNLPVAPYTRGAELREMILAQWMPALDAFKPEMIFISAGFDAHREDELGQLGLVEEDYAWITRQLMAVAGRHAKGRVVSCLEGGYALSALSRSVAAHLRVLADV